MNIVILWVNYVLMGEDKDLVGGVSLLGEYFQVSWEWASFPLMGVGGGGGGGDLLVDTRRQRVKYMNLAHAHWS